MKSPKPSVTLEDLLRVKRSEQPAPAFWNEFERELRAKQLAAIVEPRRWWTPYIRLGSKLNHLQLPVGAAAILALTLVTIREDKGVGFVPTERATAIVHQPAHASITPAPGNSALLVAPEVELASHFVSDEASSASEPNYASAYTEVEETIADSTSGDIAVESIEPSPSARYIAANLAAAQEADPGLMDEVFGQSLRHVQSRQPIREPLAHVNSPGESRRSRLLATALPVNDGGELVGHANERLGRKLTEERLYDTISRVGVKGDRVAIKF
jgi:hypothetical protein